MAPGGRLRVAAPALSLPHTQLRSVAAGGTESLAVECTDHDVSVGLGVLRVRALLDRNQFADPLGEAAAVGVCDASWPLFGMLWPSAFALARHLEGVEVGARRMLEFGCGLGLVSLLAQRRGIDVTATDHNPAAARFLHHNSVSNNLAPVPFFRESWSERGANLQRPFGLIVASDVLYEPGHAALVAGFVDRHAAPDATVIVVDPGRRQMGRFGRVMVSLDYVQTDEIPVPFETSVGRFAGRIHTWTRTA